MKRLFPFSRRTAWRIVKKAFPDLYPNYFRMNRILRMGGYTAAANEFGLATSKTRYAKGWIQIKKKCISEFGNMCPITGESDKLHVHHIDFNPLNNEPKNLIPLWKPYHTLIHARAGFSEDYKTLDRMVLSSITEVWCG